MSQETTDNFDKELVWCIQKLTKAALKETNQKKCNKLLFFKLLLFVSSQKLFKFISARNREELEAFAQSGDQFYS